MSRPTTPTRRVPRFVTPSQGEDEDFSASESHGKRRHSEIEDPNYSPRNEHQGKRAVAKKYTPKKRRKAGSSVATYARANAADAYRVATSSTPPRSLAALLDHYHGEVPCLISRKQREMDCVETCHVIPKAVDYEMLDRLEWVWGFKYFTMNVDTRYNLIHLNAVLHGAFDRKGWLLLPVDIEILEELRRATRNPPLKFVIHEVYKGKKTFRYKFIPLPPMNGLSLSRYDGTYTTEPGPTNTTLHFYPFDRLPIVESHVYPHYVIYDLGEKLKHFFGEDLDQEPTPGLAFDEWVDGLNTFYNLGMCHKLYMSWAKVTPPSWYVQGKEDDDNAPDGNGTAEDTARSTAGSRETRSKSRSQARGEDGGGGSRDGAAADDIPKAPEDEPFYVDPIDNVIFPGDSVSCHNGLSSGVGDGERYAVSEHNGDSDCGFSDSSWINDLQAWRTNVQTAVQEEVWSEVEATANNMSACWSSDGSFSESSTVFESTVGGLASDESCRDAIDGIKQQGVSIIPGIDVCRMVQN